MSKNINILVTSISKKVPLIKSLRNAVNKIGTGTIIGADMNENCIGKYFVDSFWQMPPLLQLDLNELIEYCKKNNVKCIIPTRDGDLPFFAYHREELLKNNICTMVSPLEAIEICNDKLKFYMVGKKLGYPVIVTTTSIDELECISYVVKERYGAGSRSIGINLNKEQALYYATKLENPIYQPYIEGKEYSIDLYIDAKGKTKGVVVRTRELVINGESQITCTIRNDILERVCSDLAESISLYGHVVMQVIIDCESQIHIIECNSRFGGASSISIKAGVDSFYWFLLESLGENLNDYPFIRSATEKKQIRYAEDLII
ncbi:MAG: ATP-grasp domain-containing protein [Peptococcaceae bacterium]|nr:ATP-grasp domain-containing protein [Peptococcaceae bacterium]